MKEQKIIGAVIVVLVLGLVTGGTWWFSQSSPSSSAGTSQPVPSSAMMAHDIATTPPPAPQTNLSPAPPASAVASTVASAPSGGAPAQLQTTIQEMARLFKAGDIGTVQKTYRPPAMTAQLTAQDQATLNQLAQGASPEVFAMLGQELDSIQNQTPAYNTAGDKATFQAPMPAGMQGSPGARPITFTKINGQWYLDSTASPDFWVLF